MLDDIVENKNKNDWNKLAKPELPEIVRPANYTPPEWLITGKDFPIVGRGFSTGEFIEYVKWVQVNEEYSWKPGGITMHHTGVPTLAQRPNGYKESNMRDYRSFYMNTRKFTHGPHIFTDDHKIWVLNPLSIRGTHATSYNYTRYGIEMLGNYDTLEDYNSDRGYKSLYIGKFAAAVLMKYAGISTGKLNFHRHDPETSKTCPGKNIDFHEFEGEVLDIYKKI